MDKIARILPYVSYKDDVIDINDTIDPSRLLPGKFKFIIYSSKLNPTTRRDVLKKILYIMCLLLLRKIN